MPRTLGVSRDATRTGAGIQPPLRPAARPGLDTADRILSLQAAAGNRAVSRLVAGTPARPEQVLARKLKKIKIQAPTAAETAILHAVDAYNKLSTSKKQPQLTARFQSLQAIDRLIYAWFGATPVTDLMTLPNAGPMRDLLRSSEQERDEIVGHLRSLKTGASLSFADLQPGETAATLAALWTSISTGAGHLKVAGDSKQQRKIFGRLAALMQTPSGRKFLAYLDAQTSGDVTIAFGERKTLKKLDPTGTLDQTGSFAAPTPLGTVPAPMTVTPAAAAVNTPTVASLIDELIKPPATAVGTFGIQGETYQRQTGTGSVTVVSPDPVLDPKRFKQSGATGNEVLTPTHITLMHELGHSLKMAAGGYLPEAFSKSGSAAPAALGLIPTTEREMWQVSKNAAAIEEYVNVKGVENPVRAESGLATREYYEQPDIVQVEQRRAPHMQAWRQIYAADPEAPDYLDEAFTRCQTEQAVPGATLFTAKTAAEVDARAAPILGDLALAGQPALLLQRKVAYLRAKLAAALTKFGDYDQTLIMGTPEYTTVVNAYATAASAPALSVKATNDLIADLDNVLRTAKDALPV